MEVPSMGFARAAGTLLMMVDEEMRRRSMSLRPRLRGSAMGCVEG